MKWARNVVTDMPSSDEQGAIDMGSDAGSIHEKDDPGKNKLNKSDTSKNSWQKSAFYNLGSSKEVDNAKKEPADVMKEKIEDKLGKGKGSVVSEQNDIDIKWGSSEKAKLAYLTTKESIKESAEKIGIGKGRALESKNIKERMEQKRLASQRFQLVDAYYDHISKAYESVMKEFGEAHKNSGGVITPKLEEQAQKLDTNIDFLESQLKKALDDMEKVNEAKTYKEFNAFKKQVEKVKGQLTRWKEGIKEELLYQNKEGRTEIQNLELQIEKNKARAEEIQKGIGKKEEKVANLRAEIDEEKREFQNIDAINQELKIKLKELKIQEPKVQKLKSQETGINDDLDSTDKLPIEQWKNNIEETKKGFSLEIDMLSFDRGKALKSDSIDITIKQLKNVEKELGTMLTDVGTYRDKVKGKEKDLIRLENQDLSAFQDASQPFYDWHRDIKERAETLKNNVEKEIQEINSIKSKMDKFVDRHKKVREIAKQCDEKITDMFRIEYVNSKSDKQDIEKKISERKKELNDLKQNLEGILKDIDVFNKNGNGSYKKSINTFHKNFKDFIEKYQKKIDDSISSNIEKIEKRHDFSNTRGIEFNYHKFRNEIYKINNNSRSENKNKNDLLFLSFRVKEYGRLIGVIDQDGQTISSQDAIKTNYIQLYEYLENLVHPESHGSGSGPKMSGETNGREVGEKEIKDALSIMGLTRDQVKNEDTLRRERKKLCFKWHPDKHQGDEAKKEAEKKFKEVEESFALLLKMEHSKDS